ncbi:class I SAM-dependent methyltransferase [Actinoplanes friuliensis]|uniref:Type 11 methyltransferase n=1 Tax=Actinoplanes friuliensis DSM 7358 TaxID=1246995 RepID=U5WA79_9ACTN|nr:class I SAM-dependent methyltransferase [Actinoplanes friuliensis]AGZ46083.1 type 11 methyltransferase [Actinoplanes friuliensis DSM 7358]
MDMDPRVRRRYEVYDEDQRLRRPGLGDLVRLRTWDIFDRYVPTGVRVADIGGGPGIHADRLARGDREVLLFDPMPGHVEIARGRGTFQAEIAEARQVPLDDASVDVVLLMGPLYHLVEPEDRLAALREAARVLRPGGLILAEIITRYAWVMDATGKGLLGEPGTWDDFDWIARTGVSKDPDQVVDGSFFAYFHRPEELRAELTQAGFEDVELLAVEGFAGLFGDLAERMREPGDLLRALRITEAEPSMLGASAHVLGLARSCPNPASR